MARYTDAVVCDVLQRTLGTLRRLQTTLRQIRDHAQERNNVPRLLWAVQRMAVVQAQIERLSLDLDKPYRGAKP